MNMHEILISHCEKRGQEREGIYPETLFAKIDCYGREGKPRCSTKT
jgi:hypothetical protein